MFKRAKIYHLKVHISHKKLKQGAKVTHPLFRPANSCGLICFRARTLALLDLSRHATLSSEYCLTKQSVFKTVTAACLKKKKNRFYSSFDGREMPFVAFSCSLSSPSWLLELAYFRSRKIFFLLRLPPSFFASRSLSLLSQSETAHSLHLFFQ